MGVSKNNGTPKWMVKIMENPIRIDDLGGFPPIFGNTHILSWPIHFSRSLVFLLDFNAKILKIHTCSNR